MTGRHHQAMKMKIFIPATLYRNTIKLYKPVGDGSWLRPVLVQA